MLTKNIENKLKKERKKILWNEEDDRLINVKKHN
jgi:hypothetical protein